MNPTKIKKSVNPLALAVTMSLAAAGGTGVARAACNPCNPCAAKKAVADCIANATDPCNPCNPCAAKAIAECENPCNPCAAKANPCNPCNPCAAKS